MEKYIISIDQSTQGTKALLFNEKGRLLMRADKAHRQIINDRGWVSHDLEEIYQNTLEVIKKLVEMASEQLGLEKAQIAALGISNQRETSCLWNRKTGQPYDNAVVWQCARATEICERQQIMSMADEIQARTGLKLSPYFPAAKYAWLLENNRERLEKLPAEELGLGTIDAYLISRLTGGESYKTDYSNASRTQLFNIRDLSWDREICSLFGIDVDILPQVCDSNSIFGYTDCQGFFENPIPIAAAMGDSHAALFGQDCRKKGMTKATYGTGSSIMMNAGDKPVFSSHGVVTSLAWGIDGKVDYVLEGNLNYTGAVISWLKDDMKLIDNPGETEALAFSAHQGDGLYLIPAFSGLGAPYWNSHARAAIVGMDRTTGRNEVVRAALECIPYQISDIVFAMEEDAGLKLAELRVDGGPTRNQYIMQFQSDILDTVVAVPDAEELSGIGAAYMAGLKCGLWGEEVFDNIRRQSFEPAMEETLRMDKLRGWKNAVKSVL